MISVISNGVDFTYITLIFIEEVVLFFLYLVPRTIFYYEVRGFGTGEQVTTMDSFQLICKGVML